MSEDLRKKMERLAERHKVVCEEGLGRLRVSVDAKYWFDFLSLVKMENTLSFQKLHCLTAARDEGEVFLVAELSSPHWPETLSVRSQTDSKKDSDSISSLWAYADWLECEIQDLYGVKFTRQAETYLSLPA